MAAKYRISRGALNRTLAMIVEAACDGARCPETTRSDYVKGERVLIRGLARGAATVLAAEGKIKVEIFARNFRRITILVGPHAGKATADPPFGKLAQPYRVVTTETYEFRRAKRPEPYNPARRIAP